MCFRSSRQTSWIESSLPLTIRFHFLGLAVSNFPYLVPPSLTVWDTAAAPASQIFMLLGTLFLLPIILGYTAFLYWLFRGKVRPGEGYH